MESLELNLALLKIFSFSAEMKQIDEQLFRADNSQK